MLEREKLELEKSCQDKDAQHSKARAAAVTLEEQSKKYCYDPGETQVRLEQAEAQV